MSPMLSALILAWVAIALLGLACAGLLRQLRELRATVMQGTPGVPMAQAAGTGRVSTDPPRQVPAPLLGDDQPVVVLKVDSKCVDCHAAAAELAQQAGDLADRARVVLLADRPDKGWPVQPDIDLVIDDELFRAVRAPWTPALVVADASGAVASSGPVGQPGVLAEAATAALNLIVSTTDSESTDFESTDSEFTDSESTNASTTPRQEISA